MVDVNKIKNLLNTYFRIDGSYKIDPDSGMVHVQGDVSLTKNTRKFPVQFGRVSGDLDCHNNNLTSLAGAPSYVGGDFICSHNKLTSLAGAPDHVTGHFNCFNNKLKSLLGAPSYVGGDFICSHNKLTSLAGVPANVGGNFSCFYNQLTSLAGGPDHVDGSFYCSNNILTSLSGAPQQVGGSFDCNYNQLTSLAGAPNHVGHMFVVTYASDLPLLRLCRYNLVDIYSCPTNVRHIMEKYANTGRLGALKAAAELIRAGYVENARW